MLAAYIIPIILLTLVILLYKKCFIFEDYRGDEIKIPKIVILGAYLLSLIPFIGYFSFGAIAILYPLCCDEVELRENKFTKYWF